MLHAHGYLRNLGILQGGYSEQGLSAEPQTLTTLLTLSKNAGLRKTGICWIWRAGAPRRVQESGRRAQRMTCEGVLGLAWCWGHTRKG